ncbi:hypothetical protein FOZ63_024638 [Perkinsus olseni]|uniref:TLC domain-containing protein n=1 Tax=Perkinsus olseni TaxID=32597 RepID=A0A7J6ULY7_PEROL|nr:hypothetical protein FOZ63_024638 [Perkinsus olseni]
MFCLPEEAVYVIASFGVYVVIHQRACRGDRDDLKKAYDVACLVNALVAVGIGVVSVVLNGDVLVTGVFNANKSQPLVVFLLTHSLGHLLYDLYHGLTWRPVVLPHHLVSILGILASLRYARGGLVIVVDGIITELGYLFLLIYCHYHSARVYGMVLLFYGALRLLLVAWSYSVLTQCLGDSTIPPSLQIITVLAQCGIVIVAFHFLYRHCVNFMRLARGKSYPLASTVQPSASVVKLES